jgi:hypothetical protein
MNGPGFDTRQQARHKPVTNELSAPLSCFIPCQDRDICLEIGLFTVLSQSRTGSVGTCMSIRVLVVFYPNLEVGLQLDCFSDYSSLNWGKAQGTNAVGAIEILFE